MAGEPSIPFLYIGRVVNISGAKIKINNVCLPPILCMLMCFSSFIRRPQAKSIRDGQIRRINLKFVSAILKYSLTKNVTIFIPNNALILRWKWMIQKPVHSVLLSLTVVKITDLYSALKGFYYSLPFLFCKLGVCEVKQRYTGLLMQWR